MTEASIAAAYTARADTLDNHQLNSLHEACENIMSDSRPVVLIPATTPPAPSTFGRLGGMMSSAWGSAMGLGELLFHDVREATGFALVCVVPHHIQVRFMEQVSLNVEFCLL